SLLRPRPGPRRRTGRSRHCGESRHQHRRTLRHPRPGGRGPEPDRQLRLCGRPGMTERMDPVLFEVVWHRILDITEEMGIKYMRTSGSPVLVGAYDAATGVTLPDGQLVAMGPYITTQAHVLGLIVNAVRKGRSTHPGI